jgi:hypothetical protein
MNEETPMYQRTCRIERAADDGSGIVRGVLATNGEASDGHILDIAGLEVTPGAPLLFGHQDFGPEGNLGSWVDFTKRGNRMNAIGDQQLMAVGRIEVEAGDGERLSARRDVAAMVDAGHIKSLSIRWDAIDEPVERIALPKDHPAHASREGSGRASVGFFFAKSRMLEGSIVTLGADVNAVMRHWQDAEGASRQFLARVLEEAVVEEPTTTQELRSANARLMAAIEVMEKDLTARTVTILAEGDVATPTGRKEDSPPSERKADSLTAFGDLIDGMSKRMDARDNAIARKFDLMLARIRG